MSAPYDFKQITPSVYGDRRPVMGETVALLHKVLEDRGLKLIEIMSRAVKRSEIHELMITDEDAKPGGGADRVRVIGFFEIVDSGLIVVGDEVWIEDRLLGTLAGCDLTHMPNHMNIVVKAKTLDEPVLRVGDKIRFKST